MNLLDFDANNDKDLFLIDDFSDRSEFGGLSETTLSIVKKPNQEHCCKFNSTKSLTWSSGTWSEIYRGLNWLDVNQTHVLRFLVPELSNDSV